jgi:hypothetical protein
VHPPAPPQHPAGWLVWWPGRVLRLEEAVPVPPVTTTRSLKVGLRQIQILLGALWLLDGALQLQPFMYRHAFVTSVLLPNAAGQPAPVARSIAWAAGVVSDHLILANTTFATAEALIGVGLLVRATVRAALVASLVWGISVWWLGEGFGMLLTGHASPLTGAPGAVLLYVVIAGLVWPRGTPDHRPAADGDPLPRPGGPAAWATLWFGSAALWLLPANRAPGSIHDALAGAATGEPAWLSAALGHVAKAAEGHGASIALVLAAASVAIGVGVLGARPVPFLAAGVVVSVGFWVFGQAFGGVLTGQGTDPNAGPLFVLLALTLLPRPARTAATSRGRRYSMAPGLGWVS